MRPETRDRVSLLVADLRASPFVQSLRAVVVTGSAARGEEIVIDGLPRGDIDVMVVTDSTSLRLGRSIDRVVRRHAAAGVEGGRVPIRTLERHRTLINFEAKHTGVVVFGDRALLERIPLDKPSDIARWEAVRLLCNRLFEHLKLAAGLTSPDMCTGKSYEALAEAYLILENRYRPTFAARRSELREREPLSAVDNLNEKVLSVLDWRAGRASSPRTSHTTALRDLLIGLEDVMGRYLGMQGPIPVQFQRLQRRERHLAHRLYWLGKTAVSGRPQFGALRVDPVVALWSDGFRVLAAGPAQPETASRLVIAWRSCPQIFSATTEP